MIHIYQDIKLSLVDERGLMECQGPNQNEVPTTKIYKRMDGQDHYGILGCVW